MEESISLSLRKIVGDDFVSDRQEELFLYSRDLGSARPGKVDYVVMPATAGEVREVVKLACRRKIPITPVGGGLNLSGLTIPVRGGIALDMKRMDSILEVNESDRYVVMEAGVTLGKLLCHLKKKHSGLRISVPDAPPMATVTGNVLFNGSGHLSKYGVHPDMINGLEAVLPTGEICRFGSCALAPSWFSKSPLPDLTGLFVNWFGTTGVVTRLSLKLYPRQRIREMLVFTIRHPDTIPGAIRKITATEMMEDIIVLVYRMENRNYLTTFLFLYVTADSEKELALKKELFKEMFKNNGGDSGDIIAVPKEIFPPEFIKSYMAEPKYEMGFADTKKGGGFEYLGVNLPLDRVPEAYGRGASISEKYDFDSPMMTIRNIGIGHGVIFTFMYPFNRADEESMENCRKALIETTDMVLDIGGVPWKPTIEEQQMIIKKMDPETFGLMNKVRGLLDPTGIMNPGHWEIL